MTRYRKHFDKLANEMNVDLILVVDNAYPNDPWGYALLHPYHPERRAVILAMPPNAPLPYMVGLHELGHCVRGPGWSADLEMDREIAAWEWALEHARYVPPARAARIALESLARSASRPGVEVTEAYKRGRRRIKRAAMN